MNRKDEFAMFLKNNNLPRKYLGYCETIEKAFLHKDIDDIITSQRNMSIVRDRLKKIITKNENSISQYISALNSYLKFAFSSASSITHTYVIPDFYHIACTKDVPLSREVEFICQTLEKEYAHIIKFAKDILMKGGFDAIPVIISNEQPMQENPDGGEKVLGKFFGSAKPYIEIYYRNFEPHDAALFRNCLAHEYLHYVHYVFAGKEYENADKKLKEGLADFFGFLYSIHQHGKDDLCIAKKRFNSWKKHFGTFWPYASALYFFQVNGNEIPYSSNYDKFVKHGCIEKFVQVFLNTQHTNDAYEAMLCC